MRLYFRWIVLTLLLAFVVPLVLPSVSTAQRLVRVGFIVDGPWNGNEEMLSMFQKEITNLSAGEFDVRFPASALVVSDWTLAGVRGSVDRLLSDENVDIVIALGVLCSNDIARRGPLAKPVIAPIVIDATLQGLPVANGASGVTNLNYIAFPNNLRRDMTALLQIGDFRHVAILFNHRVPEAIPDAGARIQHLLGDLGVEPILIPVEDTVDGALAKIGSDIDAVYVTPLYHISAADRAELIAELIDRKLPSYSLMGMYEVDGGILASMNDDAFARLSHQVALNIQRILLGDHPGELPVTLASGEQVTINMATARAIDVYPPWSVITEARLLNERPQKVGRLLTLKMAADDALTANLTLATREAAVLASQQEVRLARSELLPQIDLSLLGVRIDEDQAAGSTGQQAERTLSGSITLNQILFAEPAWANLSIQKHLPKSRAFDRDALKLDILQAAATAYLNILRTKTFERIQKDNAKRTRTHLDLAEVREASGTARVAEVLRWRSKLASNRKTIIEASAARNRAEIKLNLLLHRPPEESFQTQEIDLTNEETLISGGRLFQYMSNPWDFRVLRAFMAKEAVDTAPEVMRLREALAGQERALASANRSFWLPTLGLQGELGRVYEREGAGADFVAGLPPSLSSVFQEPEDLSWRVGIALNYSIDGTAKLDRRRRATHDLTGLRLQLDSTIDHIEARVRSAMHSLGASYAGIEQSRISAEAATQSFELIEDAYSRGAATILDLLDAQDTALIAEESAANQVFVFLIDLMEAERAVGKLALEMSDEERNSFFDRLDAFFQTSKNAR
jgi:outer membrane protein TolC